MKIICPYCHEENEVDINGGKSFICQSKNCKKEVMIAKVDNKSTYHWAIILLVLFIFISINAFRNNSALKNVNEELSKKLNSKTEELNKVASESQQLKSNNESLRSTMQGLLDAEYQKNASESEKLNSKIEELKQEKSDLDSKNKQLEEDKEKLKEDLRKAEGKIGELNKDKDSYIKYSNVLEEFLFNKKYRGYDKEFADLSNFDDFKLKIENLEKYSQENAFSKIYDEAINLLKEKKYVEAKNKFDYLGDFKDSKNKLDECNSYIDFCEKIKDAGKGDIITFGRYEQDSKKDGKEPIQWIILEKNVSDSKALLLSKYGLESKNYHDSAENTNWEKCSIRKWLNQNFYNESFNSIEKDNIELTNLYYYIENNLKYTTDDKVFLLNLGQFRSYFKNDFEKYKKCEPTEKVKLQSDIDKDRKDLYYWRLRAIGISVENDKNIAVDEKGIIDKTYHYDAFYSEEVKNKGLIRPAIWVKFGEE